MEPYTYRDVYSEPLCMQLAEIIMVNHGVCHSFTDDNCETLCMQTCKALSMVNHYVLSLNHSHVCTLLTDDIVFSKLINSLWDVLGQVNINDRVSKVKSQNVKACVCNSLEIYEWCTLVYVKLYRDEMVSPCLCIQLFIYICEWCTLVYVKLYRDEMVSPCVCI